MHCFNKVKFRPLDHNVYLTKQYNKNYKLEYNRDVTSQSLISHTLWLWFFPIDERKDGGDESLSLVLSSHLKLKGREKIDDIGTCSPTKCVHTEF